MLTTLPLLIASFCQLPSLDHPLWVNYPLHINHPLYAGNFFLIDHQSPSSLTTSLASPYFHLPLLTTPLHINPFRCVHNPSTCSCPLSPLTIFSIDHLPFIDHISSTPCYPICLIAHLSNLTVYIYPRRSVLRGFTVVVNTEKPGRF